MSSTAAMFTPGKSHTGPRSRLQQSAGGSHCLAGYGQESLLRTIHPERRPPALPLPGSGTEEAGALGGGSRTKRRKILVARTCHEPQSFSLTANHCPETTPTLPLPLPQLWPLSRPLTAPGPWLGPLILQAHSASTSLGDLLPGTFPPLWTLQILLSVLHL